MKAVYPCPPAVFNPYIPRGAGNLRARVVSQDGDLLKDSITPQAAAEVAKLYPGSKVEDQPTSHATFGLDWTS